MLLQKEIIDLKELLATPKKIVVLPHMNADGDAIGSTTAMKQLLNKMGHEVNIISPNEYPKFLKWIPAASSIVIADYEMEKSKRLIEAADLLFLLDFNTLSRIGKLENTVANSKAIKILIDHHQQPDAFDFVFSDTTYPATCEMVFDFIKMMGELDRIDKDMATSLYVGILTDTGNFKYPATSAKTMYIAAELASKGVEIHKIHDLVFDSSSESRLKLLSLCLNSMKTFPELKTVHFHLKRADMEKYGYQKGDTEGFVNYGLTIDGYRFSTIFLEDMKDDFIKISFRSKGDWDVNQFSRKHFNGGGHINASGGRSDDSMEKTIEKFEQIIQQYEKELSVD